MINFRECFKCLTGAEKPFLWQERLFFRLIDGQIPRACDVPTGLGKTAVISIWILALAQCLINRESPRKIPIRLVYVVDRRVIVDQSTDEATRAIHALEEAESQGSQANNPLYLVAKALRETAFVSDGPLVALSALRGQMAENREWCLDPSRPAIIIGTVDMVGSRLLFSGYGGVGRSHRSLQAGLIGQDTLILIDEAHLSPTFVGTVGDIRSAIHQSKIIRPFEVMSLSATIPKGSNDAKVDLQDEPLFDPEQELKNTEARNRLNAEKYLKWLYYNLQERDKKKLTPKEIQEQMATTIVKRATEYEGKPLSIIVFVSTVSLLNLITEKLVEFLGKSSEKRILKMTGEMRGFERDQLAENDKFKIFLPHRNRDAIRQTNYLLATSCAEVGVNLDADHGICDLTSIDRMIQRIGRINRFGKTSAEIIVVVNRSAMQASMSDIRREQSFGRQLSDVEKRIENREKEVKDLKEKTQIQKDKDEKVELKKKTKMAEAEMKTAKETRKRIKKDGVTYNEKFNEVERMDRTFYYTWRTLKSNKDREGKINVSPLALHDLPYNSNEWPALPVRPPLDSSRLDDWAMTSLRQTEFRRPLVAYWLRGVMADDTAQTTLCWRTDLNYACLPTQAEKMAEMLPVAPQERAVLATFRAEGIIKELAKRFPDSLTVIINAGGEYVALPLKELISDKVSLFGRLAFTTVIIPNKLGGLTADGNVLDKLPQKPTVVPDVVDEKEWMRYGIKKIGANSYLCGKLLRNGEVENLSSYDSFKEVFKQCAEKTGGICLNLKELQKEFADNERESGKTVVHEETQVIDQMLVAYFLNRQSPQHYLRESDDVASVGMQSGRSVDEHDRDVEQYAMNIAKKIWLPDKLVIPLGIAGSGHDRGKHRDWWQAAIGNPKTDNPDWQPLAKSIHKTFDNNVNRSYRHEFGSLVEAEANSELKAHPHCELILHLIAAHHGYARPHFPSEAFDRNQPIAVSEKIAEDAMQRFVRLQSEYGWWQLAYLEALLKAADALASRDFNRGLL